MMKKVSKLALILAAGTLVMGGLFLSCDDGDDTSTKTTLSDPQSIAETTETTTTETASASIDWTATDYAPTGTVTDKTAQSEGALGDVTVVGTGATWRVNSSGEVYCLELGKAAAGCAQFTLTKTSTVTIVAASTGGSNTSDAILTTSTDSAESSAVAEASGATTVSGSSPTTTLTYNDVAAGTYYFGAFPATTNKRGIRLYSIKSE